MNLMNLLRNDSIGELRSAQEICIYLQIREYVRNCVPVLVPFLVPLPLLFSNLVEALGDCSYGLSRIV